jgi:hypothetical protein
MTEDLRIVTKGDSMRPCRATFIMALVLVAPCLAQQVISKKFDDSPRRLRDVLTDAHVSGSLAYSASCKFHGGRFPVLPSIGIPERSGSPAEVLQSMFGENSTIRVTQEPKGLVRMAEANVPTDILDVRIHHVSFAGEGTGPIGGAALAMMTILGTPEVRAFMETHNITTGAFRLEGVNPNQPDVRGELNDVTVSEALDYVLKTLPGYWVYENCTTPEGSRSANFRFY